MASNDDGGAFMGVSKQARKDFEEGRRDSKKGLFDQTVNDVTVNHPDNSAYYKGRKGEQLDKDKKPGKT
jgi:hypothetical protein